jgi:hypothetical protein
MHPLTSQCTATSKRSGERCKRLVIGGKVCRIHGGAAPQVAEKRRDRIDLAEALADSPRRSPWEVLADVLHSADVIAQSARKQVTSGEVTPETLFALTDAIERAGRWAKTALDAGVDERRIQVAEDQGMRLANAIRAILDRLDLTEQQRVLVGRVVPEELRRAGQAGETT